MTILNCTKCGSHFRESYACQGLCPECIRWALIYQRVQEFASIPRQAP